jgi:isopropylmalate/homocitrate/citramalate synthase
LRKTIFKKLEAQGLIANYNCLRKNLPPKLPERVFIWDETMNAGTQPPTVFLTYVEKVKLAKLMDETGIAMISVGHPAASEEEKTSVRKIANEGFQQASLVAAARATRTEVNACLECGISEIAIHTPFNELNLQHRLKTTKQQVLEKTIEAVTYAKKHGVKVNLVLEDASRTPIEDILQIFVQAAKAGADRLSIADTLGFLRPLSMRYVVSHVREGLEQSKVKEVPLCVHCNNDFGLATANTLAAVEEGVAHVRTSIAGFGDRAGAAPLDEVATALELLYDIDTGVDLNKLYRLSQLAEKTFALPVQFHKPVSGDNAFSYELDELTRGMKEQPMLTEPFPPEIIGREAEFYLTKQTDKRLIAERLAQAEVKASPMQVEEVMRRMRRLQESTDKGEAQMTFYQIKKLLKELRIGISEEDFWRIVEETTRQKPKLKPKEPVAPT